MKGGENHNGVQQTEGTCEECKEVIVCSGMSCTFTASMGRSWYLYYV